jgi:hypothetical protein
MGSERRNGIPRAAATRGNDRINTRSRGLSFSRVWLPRAKNPGLSFGLRPGGEKIDSLRQGEMGRCAPERVLIGALRTQEIL